MATPNGSPDGTLYGISYEEKGGSGEFRIGRGGASGTRIFWVDWSDRITFAQYLTGKTYSDGLPTSPNSFILLPQSFPGYPTLYCTDAVIKPLKISSAGSYSFAEVTATYAPLDFNTDDNTDEERVIATLESDFAGEFLLFDGKDLFFDTNADDEKKEPIGTQESKFVATTTHTYTEEESPTNKRSTIQSYRGKINSAAWEGAAAETLLFVGARVTRTYTTEGTQPYTIVYNFLERDNSWNKFFNRETQSWEFVYDKDGNKYSPYDTVSFDGLIS